VGKMHRPLPKHLPALDDLRGLAALTVVLVCCSVQGYLPGLLGGGLGQVGVLRLTHFEHHRHTNDPELDPDFGMAAPTRLGAIGKVLVKG
jgi:fatty acid desaturase